MEIETYEIAEVANNTDDSAETRALIESLGLNGQKMLNGDRKEIFPYRKMTQEEMQVYSVILPQKTKAKDYASGAIPLRVLQVMAHANETGMFYEFEVWHPEDVRKDPLLVGLKENPARNWDPERFILARWGEVLESLDVLKAKAVKQVKENIRGEAVALKSKMDMVLSSIDEWSAKKVFETNIPSFFVH